MHVIDISGSEGRDPIEDFITINNELKKYSEKLSNRKQIIVANKSDAINEDSDNFKRLEELCKKNNLEIFKISAVTGEGVSQLMEHTYDILKTIPEEENIQIDEIIDEINLEDQIWEVKKLADDLYEVTGKPVERLMKRVNIFDLDSRKYMQRVLNKMGITQELKNQGIKDGDTVKICDYELEYSN